MPAHSLSLAGAALQLDIRVDDLCASYLAIGGELHCADMWRCLITDTCSAREHNLIAQALNERFLETGRDDFPVAYRPEPPAVD